MIFILLDQLMNGLFMVIAVTAVWVAIDMARYVFGGQSDER